MRATAFILIASFLGGVGTAGADDGPAPTDKDLQAEQALMLAQLQHSNQVLAEAKQRLEGLLTTAQAEAAMLRRDLQQLQGERAAATSQLHRLADALASRKRELRKLYASNRQLYRRLAEHQQPSAPPAARRPAPPGEPK